MRQQALSQDKEESWAQWPDSPLVAQIYKEQGNQADGPQEGAQGRSGSATICHPFQKQDEPQALLREQAQAPAVVASLPLLSCGLIDRSEEMKHICSQTMDDVRKLLEDQVKVLTLMLHAEPMARPCSIGLPMEVAGRKISDPDAFGVVELAQKSLQEDLCGASVSTCPKSCSKEPRSSPTEANMSNRSMEKSLVGLCMMSWSHWAVNKRRAAGLVHVRLHGLESWLRRDAFQMWRLQLLQAKCERARRDAEAATTKLAEWEKAVLRICSCPLTGAIMSEPVLGSDGVTYEASWIKSWLEKKFKSPVTRMGMPPRYMWRNSAVEEMVRLLSKAGVEESTLPPPEWIDDIIC